MTSSELTKAQLWKGISNLEIAFIGEDLSEGPLPTAFYFALSARDSLELDPYNQFPIFLSQSKLIRVFSFTLPFHGQSFDPKHAMTLWAEKLQKEPDFLMGYIQAVADEIEHLFNQKLLVPGKIACAGLSRGGFIATHVAALQSLVSHIIGFSPVTYLSSLKEFIDSLDTIKLFYEEKHLSQLIRKDIRYYIGNHDTRVDTKACFEFLYHLSQLSYRLGQRSPLIELYMNPSIGHQGHGTGPHIFRDGALWLQNKWGMNLTDN